MPKTLVEQFVENPAHMRLYQQERAIYEVTELIESLLEELGINRTELAKRLGKSKGWVTQLLDGESNKTIRTVADTFAVLGCEFHSFHSPIQVSNRNDAVRSTVQSVTVSGSTTKSYDAQVLHIYRSVATPTFSANTPGQIQESA